MTVLPFDVSALKYESSFLSCLDEYLDDELALSGKAESPTPIFGRLEFFLGVSFEPGSAFERLPVAMLPIPQRSPYASTCPERKKSP